MNPAAATKKKEFELLNVNRIQRILMRSHAAAAVDFGETQPKATLHAPEAVSEAVALRAMRQHVLSPPLFAPMVFLTTRLWLDWIGCSTSKACVAQKKKKLPKHEFGAGPVLRNTPTVFEISFTPLLDTASWDACT